MLALAVTLALSVSPELEDGRAAVSRLEYQKAIGALSKVVGSPAPSIEKAEAYGLLARSYLALGKTDEARAAFEGQLTEDPMSEEPSGAPKMKQAFLSAKRAKFSPTFVQLLQRTSGADTLVVDVVNPWRVPVSVELAAWVGTAEPSRRPVPLDGQRLVVALAPGTKHSLRALGSDGVVLAALGSPAAPIEGPPLPPEPAKPSVVEAKNPPEVNAEPKPDAPRSAELTPRGSLVPVSKGVADAMPSLGSNRGLGWLLTGTGAIATVAGLIVLVLGVSDISSAEDIIDFTVSDRLKRQGELKLMLGGVIGGAGLISLGVGTFLLANAK